jgi:hypothetical protein
LFKWMCGCGDVFDQSITECLGCGDIAPTPTVSADASREKDENDLGAGLIHQVASPLAGTEPRLIRYGVKWPVSTGQPTHEPMEDGYWTPWHLAEAAASNAALLAKAVVALWDDSGVQDADDWLYRARQIAGSVSVSTPAERAETTRRSEAK